MGRGAVGAIEGGTWLLVGMATDNRCDAPVPIQAQCLAK